MKKIITSYGVEFEFEKLKHCGEEFEWVGDLTGFDEIDNEIYKSRDREADDKLECIKILYMLEYFYNIKNEEESLGDCNYDEEIYNMHREIAEEEKITFKKIFKNFWVNFLIHLETKSEMNMYDSIVEKYNDEKHYQEWSEKWDREFKERRKKEDEEYQIERKKYKEIYGRFNKRMSKGFGVIYCINKLSEEIQKAKEKEIEEELANGEEKEEMTIDDIDRECETFMKECEEFGINIKEIDEEIEMEMEKKKNENKQTY